jgi:hypothetical protein
VSAPETRTLRDLAAPLLAARALLSEFADLPSGMMHVTDVFPDRLDLSFHDGLDAFETWREALGIAPASVTCGEQSGGRTRVLEAQCTYAGARIRLTGFAEIPHAPGGAA